ncbi:MULTISPECIES: LysR family transcriptional regulator [unclassified Novosphingobium]|uniref:LysR family transcriptional regulator n=1 Tax=unclassified Novosphingobium TaxID=2644732 RepID=UPI00086C071E|nr:MULTISPECIES: LysR family transcriptional regulator [unclassified Novosphingobium]MBN9144472.1 LysR family transcriptional regulator [Novosphingobium sp.]MDR6707801.1 DNA-binding transcriptional LysR family regulator [Novosphingobium sp. 1748]ODU84026.1 MAG: LysR family transcriptional regulator [Novosphingobium sp. SCN 63-17]OJX93578.1 MAG: LysR family transcriptional regulator [Novosphingobium sp. 63-713]
MEAVNLNRLAYFAAVVDTGSFTRAAERLGITKTVVSQQVAKLEDELKTALLMRTTRRVEPTEAGRLLHARSTFILREAEDAIGEVTRANVEPGGVLRVAAPNDYGTSRIAPLAAAFSRRYPACRVELVLSDARIDPVANQIDLSIRVGWLDDSSLHARRVGGFRQLLVTAPQFAETMDIHDPDQVSHAPFVANAALKEPLIWHFNKGDFERRTIRMRQVLSINTTPAVLAATLAGGGLSVLPDYLVADLLSEKRLIAVLPEWSLPIGGVHVVYPTAKFRPSKVSSFVKMLMAAESGQTNNEITISPLSHGRSGTG